MAIQCAEQRSVDYRRGFDPRLDHADRARLAVRPVRNADLAARGVLVGLGPAEGDRQPVLAERAIRDVESDELRFSERPREPEQDQGPVARADQTRVRYVDHPADVVGEGWGLLRRGRPERPADAPLSSSRDNRELFSSAPKR